MKAVRLKGWPIHFVVLVIMVVCLTAPSVGAAERIIVAHDIAPDMNIPTHAYAVVFKHLVEVETGGAYRVDIFPASVLGGERERLDQTADGMIHVNLASVGGAGMIFKPFYLYNTPFMYRSDRVYREFFADNKWNDYVFDLFKKATRGLVPIHAYQRGTLSAFTNNVRPIRSMADFKGIKFRAMDEIQIAMFKALGADATVIPFAEVYTGLQTGTVDGQVNPIDMIVDMGFHEVQKYLTLAKCIPGSGMVLVNEAWYNGLPQNVREIVDQAFHDASIVAAGLSHKKYIETLKFFEDEKVIEVNSLYSESPEEYKKVREAGRNAALNWARGAMDPEIVNSFEKAVLELEREIYGN